MTYDIERYGHGFLVSRYDEGNGAVRYADRYGTWHRQPISVGHNYFPTEDEAKKFIAREVKETEGGKPD